MKISTNNMEISRVSLIYPFLFLLSSSVCLSDNLETKIVIEGQDVVLECRFPPALASSDATLYWIRSSNNQHDKVAIRDTPYSSGYTVEHQPELGRYNLKIATYDRDNGNFECRKVEFMTGNKLHSSLIILVVLLPPSQPTVAPTKPTVTEGKDLNITCSSIGGSPPPEVLWFKNGDE